MASAATASDGKDGGLPLDAFTKTTPPGWRPGNPKYPIRRYMQLLRLWWKQTDVQDQCLGPVIAGRLRGTAFQFAMAIQAERLDLSDPDAGIRRTMVGEELLSQASHIDHTDRHGRHHPASDNGAQLSVRALQDEYGIEPQELTLCSLDSFCGQCRRGEPLCDFLNVGDDPRRGNPLCRLGFEQRGKVVLVASSLGSQRTSQRRLVDASSRRPVSIRHDHADSVPRWPQ